MNSEIQDDELYDAQEKVLRQMYGDINRLKICSIDDSVFGCPLRCGILIEWCKTKCDKFIKINESYVYCRR